MTCLFVFENNEVHRVELRYGGSVFSRLEEIQKTIDITETNQNRRVKLVELTIESGPIDDSSARFIRKNFGVSLRRNSNGDKTLVTIGCSPENLQTYMLAVMSAIDVGEKLQRLIDWHKSQSKTDLAIKERAQINIKTGRIMRDCPLVKFIAEKNYGEGTLSGEQINTVARTLELLPDRKEVLIEAYQHYFGEALPNPKQTAFDAKVFTDNKAFDDMMKVAKKRA